MWLQEALQGTEEHSPCLVFVKGAAHHVDPAAGGKPRPLGNSNRKQWVLKCRGCWPGQQHYRLMSLHAVKGPSKLLCMYCARGTPEWRGAQLTVSSLEVVLVECIQLDPHLQLHEFVWQCMLPWWPAPMDFVHMPTHTAVQVDGAGHFEGWFNTPSAVTIPRDMRCCIRAATAGSARLVRVAEHDLGTAAALIRAALECPAAGLVLLSAVYDKVLVEVGETKLSYPAHMLQQMQAARPGVTFAVRALPGGAYMVTWCV
jgi:hypothetical protein